MADFIFKICDSKPEKGIEIKKLKDVLEHDKEHKDFLKLFMCFFGDNKFENNTILDEKKFLKKFKEKVRMSFQAQFIDIK